MHGRCDWRMNEVVRCTSVIKERMDASKDHLDQWVVLVSFPKEDCLGVFSDRSFLHPLISVHVRSIMAQNSAVELNQVVGSHLLSLLEGIDAINFIEAVNDSKQFWCIAKSLDQHFIKLISTFQGQNRILLPRAFFESYMG